MKNPASAPKASLIAVATIAALTVFAGCDRKKPEDTSSSTTSSTTTTTTTPGTTTPSTTAPGSSSTTTVPPGTTTESGTSSTGGGMGGTGTGTGTGSGMGSGMGTPPGTGTGSGSGSTSGTTGSPGTGSSSGTSGGTSSTDSTTSTTRTGPNSSLEHPAKDRLGSAGQPARLMSQSDLRQLYGIDMKRVADTGSRAATSSNTTGADAELRKTRGSEGGGALSRDEQKFVQEAAEGGMFEVEIARTAVERATDPAVKSYASTLVTQHSAANEELKDLAKKRNIDIKKELPSDKRQSIDRLGKRSGGDFDKQFLEIAGVKEHEKDIKMFEKASKDAKDPQLKAWIDKTLPTLREHLAEARKLAGNTGSSRGAGSSTGNTGSTTGSGTAGTTSSTGTTSSGMGSSGTTGTGSSGGR